METNESRPLSDLLSMGTPMTANVVNAAVTPGRCAAPPAAAMMTRRPRSCALPAYCSKSFGVRCAEMTFASLAMPNCAHTSAAAFIVGQSESLPMRIPTKGLDSLTFIRGQTTNFKTKSHHLKIGGNQAGSDLSRPALYFFPGAPVSRRLVAG